MLKVNMKEAKNRIDAARCKGLNSLDLSSLGLTTEDLAYLLPKIQKVEGLERLYLNDNYLYALPENLFNLAWLKELDLEDNLLIDLPSAIGKLSRLKKLDVNYNRLRLLPEEISNLRKLVELNLEGNHLIEVPESLAELADPLVGLNLKNNPLTQRTMNWLAVTFDQYTLGDDMAA